MHLEQTTNSPGVPLVFQSLTRTQLPVWPRSGAYKCPRFFRSGRHVPSHRWTVTSHTAQVLTHTVRYQLLCHRRHACEEVLQENVGTGLEAQGEGLRRESQGSSDGSPAEEHLRRLEDCQRLSSRHSRRRHLHHHRVRGPVLHLLVSAWKRSMAAATQASRKSRNSNWSPQPLTLPRRSSNTHRPRTSPGSRSRSLLHLANARPSSGLRTLSSTGK